MIGILVALALLVCAGIAAITPAVAKSSKDNTGGFSMANVISSIKMFYGAGELEGGNGTTYNGNIIDADAAVVDSDDEAGYLTAKESEGDYDVKYAVSIWGINHDTCVDDNGNTITAGLTFGPATGADYTDSYEAHLTEEEFLEGNNGVCLHWMTWEEIIIQSEIDPTAFEECLENGCTHSVELVLNDTIIGTSYAGEMDNGDGAGTLYSSILYTYRFFASTSGGYTGSHNCYSASRIRTTLNGMDGYADSLFTGTATALNESNCLFSCFPEVLQDAIVAKAVRTNSVLDSTDEADVITTYDNLWLFAYYEVVEADGSGISMFLFEGSIYEKMTYSNKVVQSETRSNIQWMTRSAYNLANSTATQLYVIYSDKATAASAVVGAGISPGFCIP